MNLSFSRVVISNSNTYILYTSLSHSVKDSQDIEQTAYATHFLMQVLQLKVNMQSLTFPNKE